MMELFIMYAEQHSASYCLRAANTTVSSRIFLINTMRLFCRMYSREAASLIKQEFWTVFGQYMRPVPSAEGLKINWINYHTGVRDVFFRMEAGAQSASIAISFEHRDTEIQALYFEQMLELKTVLHNTLEEKWQWRKHQSLQHGKIVSRIYCDLPNVSVFNKDHWPTLISFFKPRLIALDSFWENARYHFEALG